MIDITSKSNERIKWLIKLRERSVRAEAGLFGVEGAREIECALRAGFKPQEVFFSPAVLSKEGQSLWHYFDQYAQLAFFRLTKEVFEKVAVRSGSDGVYIIFSDRNAELSLIPAKKDLFLVVLEDVEKPGNIGAALRSSEGAGVDGVIIVDKTADIFHPNVIRASLGAVFNLPVIIAPPAVVLDYLRQRNAAVICASPAAQKLYYQVDFKRSIAIVLGSEADGISDFWMQNADDQLRIPMNGHLDSLNVSVAAGIMMYEVVRQRG